MKKTRTALAVLTFKAYPRLKASFRRGLTLKSCPSGIFFMLAERGGFEPPVPLRVRQFSKLLVSATHPPLRVQTKILVLLMGSMYRIVF